MKRSLISGFIIVWLAVQIVFPFIRKFDFPNFHYHYATFSWAMYAKPALVYNVSLFKKNKSGQYEAIPTIEQFVHGYQSPQPMKIREYYRTRNEVQERFTRLITYIARQVNDSSEYAVSIDWISPFELNLPRRWEFRTAGKAS